MYVHTSNFYLGKIQVSILIEKLFSLNQSNLLEFLLSTLEHAVSSAELLLLQFLWFVEEIELSFLYMKFKTFYKVLTFL